MLYMVNVKRIIFLGLISMITSTYSRISAYIHDNENILNRSFSAYPLVRWLALWLCDLQVAGSNPVGRSGL